MSALSDSIESFIKQLLEGENEAELKRNQLAAEFHCAPSQINYVLQTRFTNQRGYIVESRRGGGGYIRIVRMVEDGADLLYQTATSPRERMTYPEAHALLVRLVQSGALTTEKAQLMQAAVSKPALCDIEEEKQDAVRARIFHTMLLSLIRSQQE